MRRAWRVRWASGHAWQDRAVGCGPRRVRLCWEAEEGAAGGVPLGRPSAQLSGWREHQKQDGVDASGQVREAVERELRRVVHWRARECGGPGPKR